MAKLILTLCGWVLRGKNEPTLYLKHENTNSDHCDLLETWSNEDLVSQFKTEIKSQFEMSGLGAMKHFLGMEVVQNKLGIFISQTKYVSDLLKKFKLDLSF